MIYIRKNNRKSRAGLTLAELMVAAGILAVITIFSARVMSDVTRVWLGGKGTSDSFMTARALMTRFRLDIERSVLERNLPGFVRNPDAERLQFSTQVRGIAEQAGGGGAQKDQRPFSFVRYSLGALGSRDEGYIIRADQSFSWEDSPFGASDGEPKERRLCPNVVGFTHRFVQRNGELESQYVRPPSTNQTVALQLALAVCDDRTFQTLKLSGQLSQVSEVFKSLEPEKWDEAVSGESASLPVAARQGVRVFHQVVPLPTTRKEN